MNSTQAHEHTEISHSVLLVDDTPENLTVLGEILIPHYKVKVASSGARALKLAEVKPQPDLILLDVMMPDMNGYQVIQSLRSNPETADIPVIFVTAMDAVEDETYGFNLGAVDYITKPVVPAVVLARVNSQIELKQARDLMRAQNQWLENEVQRRMRQNQMIQEVSLRALASIAESRDTDTGNHILRTQAYVKILAEELAQTEKYAPLLEPHTVELFVQAAPLHDIGKVSIPDHILNKPGKLNPEEWAVMQTHAKAGADAIWRAIHDEEDRGGLDFLYIAMEIAHYHHEKWDGSGYPDQLAGEQIPLAARLMAVADVFDALVNQRVYKPAFTIEQATEIIREGKGSHFDPDIVDAYLKHLADFREVAARFADHAY